MDPRRGNGCSRRRSLHGASSRTGGATFDLPATRRAPGVPTARESTYAASTDLPVVDERRKKIEDGRERGEAIGIATYGDKPRRAREDGVAELRRCHSVHEDGWTGAPRERVSCSWKRRAYTETWRTTRAGRGPRCHVAGSGRCGTPRSEVSAASTVRCASEGSTCPNSAGCSVAAELSPSLSFSHRVKTSADELNHGVSQWIPGAQISLSATQRNQHLQPLLAFAPSRCIVTCYCCAAKLFHGVGVALAWDFRKRVPLLLGGLYIVKAVYGHVGCSHNVVTAIVSYRN